MRLNFQVNVTAQSHAGQYRTLNEDRFLIDPASGLCAVADGMGGHQAGEVASTLCMETLASRLVGKPQDADIESAVESVRAAIEEANTAILRAASQTPNQTRMGTTIALILPWNSSAIIAHAGDSRVYRLRDGSLSQLTRDHSLLQEQVSSGLISKMEALHSHNRNLITRALGIEDKIEPDIEVIDLRAGDLFLVCSDGLTTMVCDEDLAQVLSELEPNPQLAAKVLIEVANDNGGHDNVTAALLWVSGAVQEQAPTRPSLFSRLFSSLFGH